VESGGHVAAESGGHFAAEFSGHFVAELGGQFRRNLHHISEITSASLTDIKVPSFRTPLQIEGTDTFPKPCYSSESNATSRRGKDLCLQRNNLLRHHRWIAKIDRDHFESVDVIEL